MRSFAKKSFGSIGVCTSASDEAGSSSMAPRRVVLSTASLHNLRSGRRFTRHEWTVLQGRRSQLFAQFDFAEPQQTHAETSFVSSSANRRAQLSMAYAAPPTSLHGVALAGEDEEVRTLVSRGVPLHRQDAGGWTALHYAAAADRHSTTSVLLQLGADPSVSTAAVPTLTPLHLGVSCRGGEDTLRRLIEHRAPLDARDELGQTALHLAVSMRDVSAVRILLEAVRCPFALAPPHCSTSPSPRPHLALTSPSPHLHPIHTPPTGHCHYCTGSVADRARQV